MGVANIVFILLLTYANCKLIYVYALVRHSSIYPKTDLYDGKEMKQFHGRLTAVGLRQQYNIGVTLRQLYINKLNLTTSQFNQQEVEFFAAELERTEASSLAFMYGFYPLGFGPKIPKEVPSELLNPPYTPLFPDNLQAQSEQSEDHSFALAKGFQPYPPHPLDYIIENCKNYMSLHDHAYNQIQKDIHALFQQQSNLVNRAIKFFNLSFSEVSGHNFSELYKVLLADKNIGRPMPPHFTLKDYNTLQYMYLYYNAKIYHGEYLNIVLSPNLNLMSDKLQAASKKKTQKKISFQSVHQSTIWPYLQGFNLTDSECIAQRFKGKPITSLNCVEAPNYTTSLLFELHEDDATSQQYVMLKYNSKYVYLCERKSTKCPLQEFLQRIRKAIVQDGIVAQKCKLPPNVPFVVHKMSMTFRK